MNTLSNEAGEGDDVETRLSQFQTARICHLCNNLEHRVLDGHIRQHRVAFDFSPAALAFSASICQYCAIILTGIRQFEPEVSDRSTHVSWIYARGPAELPPHTLSFEIYYKTLRPKLELELHSQRPGGAIATNSVIRFAKEAFQPREALSEETVSWVKTHVAECIDTHANCPKTRDALLPPRVLSLTATPAGSIEVVLRETNGAKGTYACLSHRWGGSDLGITTRSIYKDLLFGIPWTSLPRTFRHAIRFALALGIHNIWIDSLCIIQDDPSDWQAQAESMAGIYLNSYITLAATASPGSDSGCFWEADASFERPFSTNTEPFSVRKTIKHWGKLWTSSSAVIFPLLTRAWVFQERLLAPRVVHFSHHELVWECNQTGSCECGGYTDECNPKRRDWIWTRTDSWTTAVELFTSLSLTKEEDRLPAFLGFADRYSRLNGLVLKKEYLAGLWRKSLHAGLLWRVDAGSLAPGSEMIRLCRCWDLNSGNDGSSLRCLYSYSAACSPQCLEQRRFCRFGLPAAAVSSSTKFTGSCPEQGEKWSSIHELREFYQAQQSGNVGDRDPRPKPSWSWVSVGTGVKYWGDVRHVPPPPKAPRNFLTPCKLGDVEVIHGDQRLAGPIQHAVLKLDGWIACASLQYRYQPDPTSGTDVQLHSIFRYGLVFGAGVNRPLEFYSDYVFCFEGRGWMPAGTLLFLLHISCGIYLVLQEKKYFQLDWKRRIAKALQPLVLRERLDSLFCDPRPDERVFVRVGILRSPRTSENATYWPTRWLDGVVIE